MSKEDRLLRHQSTTDAFDGHLTTAWRTVTRIPGWLKACVAVLLMGAMILQLDWPTVAKQLHTLHWPIIAAAALLYPAALLLNAAKWWTALRLHDLRFRFNHLLRAGCVGVFLNNLLPTAIGGDIYRVYRTSNAGSTSQAVSAVLLERVVGLAVMLLNGLVGAVWLMNSSALARVYIVWAVGGFVIAAAVLILCTHFHAQLGSALLSRHLQPVVANLRRITRPHRAWPSLIIYSVAFQLVAALALYLIFIAVGAGVSFAGALLVTVAAGLAAIVPISISGIGVVEGSIVGVGVALGVPYDSAFVAALVSRALSLVTSLLCGVVYAIDGGRD